MKIFIRHSPPEFGGCEILMFVEKEDAEYPYDLNQLRRMNKISEPDYYEYREVKVNEFLGRPFNLNCKHSQ